MTPAAAIYGVISRARNALYDHGIFPQRRLAGAVVSVGNISVGGSGKTPFVIHLGKELQRLGVRFDVLSRGYGRRTRGVLEVDAKGSPQNFGDEPILIARALGCPVIVGEDRYAAGRFAESKFGPQLHILDDGFQHRRLARDFNIILLTPEDLRDRLLPAGRLREPVTSLERADAVVLTGEAGDEIIPAGKAVWKMKRSIVLQEVGPVAPSSDVRDRLEWFAFCGIAKPEALVSDLKALGIQPAAQRFYRDHHYYSDADIRELVRLRDQVHASGFITTEKDAVNLGERLADLGSVSVARLTVQLDPADAVDEMLRIVSERRATP